MAFCRKCGKQIADDAEFCRYCGTQRTIAAPQAESKQTDVTPVKSDVTPVYSSEAAAKKKDINVKKIAIIAVVCLAVVGIILAFVLRDKSVDLENIMILCENGDAKEVVTEEEIQSTATVIRDYLRQGGYDISDDAFYFFMYDQSKDVKSGNDIHIHMLHFGVFDGHYMYSLGEVDLKVHNDKIELTPDGQDDPVEGKKFSKFVNRKNNTLYGLSKNELKKKLLKVGDDII